MFPASAKYFGEQDPRHGGILHWPGVQGLPFRGDAVPNLLKRELEKLPVVATANHKLFDMGAEEDNQLYQWVRERIRNGMFTCDFVERWHDANNCMWIYLEWSQLYVQQPRNIEIGSNGNGSPNHFTLRSTE